MASNQDRLAVLESFAPTPLTVMEGSRWIGIFMQAHIRGEDSEADWSEVSPEDRRFYEDNEVAAIQTFKILEAKTTRARINRKWGKNAQ